MMSTSITSKNPLKAISRGLIKAGKGLIAFLRDEDIFQVCKKLITQELRSCDKAMLWVCGISIIIMPFISFLINTFGQQYQTPELLNYIQPALPAIIIMLLLAVALRKRHFLSGELLFIIVLTVLSTYAMSEGAMSVMSTPMMHNLLDYQLLHIDKLLHFHQQNLLAYVTTHPTVHKILINAYSTFLVQATLIPIFLTITRSNRSARIFLLCCGIGFTMAYIIYYIYPSLPPAAVIQSPYFSNSSYFLIERTMRMHQHISYDLHPMVGLIAFPSCHVIMALSAIGTLFLSTKEPRRIWQRASNWTLAVIILLTNIALIFATIGLGYHYLVDLIASFIIVVPSFWLSLKLAGPKENYQPSPLQHVAKH